MCNLLWIEKTIKEECALLYRKATDGGFRKRDIKRTISVSVTINKGEIKTLKEISKKSEISKKEIDRSYKKIVS